MKHVKLMGCMLMAVTSTGQLMAASSVHNLLNLNQKEIQDFSEGNLLCTGQNNLMKKTR